jgi:sialic acid synthase SpsE
VAVKDELDSRQSASVGMLGMTGWPWVNRALIGSGRRRAVKVFRRSLYFVKDLPAGHRITPEDIRRIRPGMGLALKYFDQVVGSRLSQAVKRGTPVNWDSIVSNEVR